MNIDYNLVLREAEKWTNPPFDEATRKEISALIEEDQRDELIDRFYKSLSFGTGGMRGIMGNGINRMNRYTYGRATQGLARYLLKSFPGENIKVAIGYDCRHNSGTFARVVADVLTANGIGVYLFKEMRPTPELSFAVRHLSCHAGIVLTASHNPPEYNGYKVYWRDGGQIVPPEDGEIVEEIAGVAFEDIRFEPDESLLHFIGDEVDEAFWKASVQHGTFDTVQGRDKLKIVFTSIHGTSIKLVPEALRRAGYTDLHIVEEQAVPDGDFPTVKSPNPEEPEAMSMAIELADKIGADIVLGTDPDSDRIAVGVRNHKGEMTLLNGNQSMSMMVAFLLKQWQKAGRLNGKQFVGSTVVSTELVNAVAESYGVETKVGLTGFKWIAKMIRDYEGELEFIGGGEESFGFMVGDFVRDKDAVTSALLACEIAAEAKSRGSSFYGELLALYEQYDLYMEHLIALVKKGISGAAEIQKMMDDWRTNPPQEIDGSPVTKIHDHLDGTGRFTSGNKTFPLHTPKSNVLIFYTLDGTKVAARPSGTEPKIKFYISVHRSMGGGIEEFEKTAEQMKQKIRRIVKELHVGD